MRFLQNHQCYGTGLNPTWNLRSPQFQIGQVSMVFQDE